MSMLPISQAATLSTLSLIRRNYDRRKEIGGRLASGLRLTMAKTDPAGLAVASNLDSRARSMRVALRNSETALSALDIADGGLREIANNVHRLRELAVQASSETLSDAERKYLAEEFGSVKSSIDATARGAVYEGTSLLVPPGIDVGFIVDTSGSMGGELVTLANELTVFYDLFAAAGTDLGAGLAEASETADPIDRTNRIIDMGGAGFLEALEDLVVASGALDPYGSVLQASGVFDFAGFNDPDAFNWRDTSMQKHLIYVSDAGREIDITPGAETQASVAADLAAAGVVVHVIAPPFQFPQYSTLTAGTGGELHSIGNGFGSGIGAALASIATTITDSLDDYEPLEVQVGIDGDANSRIEVGLPGNASASGLGVAGESVETVAKAQSALAQIDKGLDRLNGMMASVGASQNRVEYAIANTTTQLNATTAAQSRIEDADYAKEAAEMAKAEILGQAQLAVLSLAGQINQGVLKLL